MSIAINILSIMLFTWPSVVVGYLFEAVSLGFWAGKEMFAQHVRAADEHFNGVKK